MPDEPLDLDDDDEIERRVSRVVLIFGLAKWLLLGAAVFLGVIALNASDPAGATVAVLACFLIAAARIAQAEEHRWD